MVCARTLLVVLPKGFALAADDVVVGSDEDDDPRDRKRHWQPFDAELFLREDEGCVTGACLSKAPERHRGNVEGCALNQCSW